MTLVGRLATLAVGAIALTGCTIRNPLPLADQAVPSDGGPSEALDAATPPGPDMAQISRGAARFQVVSPTVIRLEYAEDGRFEDRPSFNVLHRLPFGAVPHADLLEDGWRVIRTEKLELRYQEGSGAFNPNNVVLTFAINGEKVEVHPWGTASPNNLKGWYRALDGEKGPVTLHDGLLSRDGWYLLDDSSTALWDGEGSMPSLPVRGIYQSGYVFAYGHNYKQALREFAALTGPAPLPPRWVFGNWYSRYYPYRDDDYRNTVIPKFRGDQVPLDVLVIDTDWKQPSDFIGWNWNLSLFPQPEAFLKWTRSNNLNVTLNVHPAIDSGDPRFHDLDLMAGGLTSIGGNKYIWDWGQPSQIASYFSAHKPFTDEGVRFWWLDWCCDPGKVSLAGVTQDTWINQLYAKDALSRAQRPVVFSRIGAFYAGYAKNDAMGVSGPWADHRYALHFTGDTAPNWETLQFEGALTVGEGNIGLPYVTHDIGSFYGTHLPDDLYVRWVQFGTFQPILRLHSNHGDRLPWDYEYAVKAAAEKFLRLRAALAPYLYTLAREAYDTGMPMTRGLYLDYPDAVEAYTAPNEYLLGEQLLVAPIASAGTTATRTIWVPDGTWYGFFDDKIYSPGIQEVTATLDVMPVLVRGGSILPLLPYRDHVGVGPDPKLLLKIYPGGSGSYSLYEDAGDGLGYQSGEFTRTTFTYSEPGNSERSVLTIGAAVGHFTGQLMVRDYDVEFHAVSAPKKIVVDGQELPMGTANGTDDSWWFSDGVLHVGLKNRSTAKAISLVTQ